MPTPMSDVATTLADHDARVAADTSAARLLVEEYADTVRDAITRSLMDDEGYEYGVSLARPTPDAPFVVGGPTRGIRPGEVSVHAPKRILEQQSDASLPDDVREDISREPLRCQYADLIKLHTHFQHDGDEVGLSYGDLTDAVPGPDAVITQDIPMELYRAQGAIVYTDDESRLPLAGRQTQPPDGDTNQPWPTNTHVFESRPDVRPWLHLVERTQAAVEMDKREVKALHHESLHHDGKTHAEKFRNARDTLGKTVAELIVPLSP